MSRRIPFGRYRGELLEDVPMGYLRWLCGIELREPLRTDVEEELRRRQANPGAAPVCLPAPVQEAAREIIAAGFRTLAKNKHPDAGGSHEAMLNLTAARDALAELVGAP